MNTAYGSNWGPGVKRGASKSSGVERRSSDGDQPGYLMSSHGAYGAGFQDHRAGSTSSAMPGLWGTGNITASPEMHTRSPQPARFNINMNPHDWATDQQVQVLSEDPSLYPGVPGAGHYFPEDTSNTTYFRTSESGSPSTSSAFQSGGAQDGTPFGSGSGFNSPMSMSPSSFQNEINKLLAQVHQLQKQHRHDQDQIRALESRVRGLPTTISPTSTPPPTPAFLASWKARTEARVKIHCSLNRAGNALCSWHDFRREKRAYPPRTAPHGYLNCGCSYEECLFEEALARHGVGSYLPGEAVRMDPALRNPLLKLLQQRYGYRDGDFERDRSTGEWIPGEGADPWERQLQAGNHNPRTRPRMDSERR